MYRIYFIKIIRCTFGKRLQSIYSGEISHDYIYLFFLLNNKKNILEMC